MLPFDEYKSIYSKVPRLTVEIIIRNSQGTLLTLRKMPPHKDEWHLPGGTVYFHETIAQAAARIADQELGLKIKIKKLLGFIEYLSEDRAGGFDHPVGLALLCEPLTPLKNINLDKQAHQSGFFSTLPDNTVPEQKRFLEEHES